MVDQLEFERRVTIGALVCTFFSAVIWLTAISTNEWCSVTFDHWTYIESTHVSVKGYNIGLWNLCAYVYYNATNTSEATGPSMGVLTSWCYPLLL